MARRKLTLEDQLRGVRGAIRSPKTPPQLKGGLRLRKVELEKRLRVEPGQKKKGSRKSRLLKVLGL